MSINFKKLAIVLFMAFFCFYSSYAQGEGFTLTIKAPYASAQDKAFLCYSKDGSIHVDSVEHKNNSFRIKGNIAHPQRAVVYLAPGNTDFFNSPKTTPGITVYLESGTIQLTIGEGGVQDTEISGTKLNNEYQQLILLSRPFKQKEAHMEADFSAAKSNRDTEKMNQLQQDYMKLLKERQEVEKGFFSAHLDSEVSLDWLYQFVDPYQDKKEAETMFSMLSERLQNTRSGKMYANRLASIVTVELGDIAPAIFSKSPEGKDLSLSSVSKDNYVLIDFWASWCGPCRKENPVLVEAYKEFHPKNFEILGVSLDNSRDAWITAIGKDNLLWPQVSDLGGWESGIAAQYGVRSIPANFLIDPQGKVIAKNLRGEELKQKLNEIFQ